MEENNKFKILFESIKSKLDYLSNTDNTFDGKGRYEKSVWIQNLRYPQARAPA